MSLKLFFEAIFKFLLGVILVAIFIFVPAGSLNYWNRWIYMFVQFVPMFVAGIVMMCKSPDLLRSRLKAKESQKEQDEVVKLSAVMFLVGFIVAGLNFSFKWSILPNWVVYFGTATFLISYVLYVEVLRENQYLSRVIEVQENQTVVDTGLYRIVRHPMYAATLILFLSIPLILGSIISFVIFLVYPLIIARRIKFEEEFLKKNCMDMLSIRRK